MSKIFAVVVALVAFFLVSAEFAHAAVNITNTTSISISTSLSLSPNTISISVSNSISLVAVSVSNSNSISLVPISVSNSNSGSLALSLTGSGSGSGSVSNSHSTSLAASVSVTGSTSTLVSVSTSTSASLAASPSTSNTGTYLCGDAVTNGTEQCDDPGTGTCCTKTCRFKAASKKCGEFVKKSSCKTKRRCNSVGVCLESRNKNGRAKCRINGAKGRCNKSTGLCEAV